MKITVRSAYIDKVWLKLGAVILQLCFVLMCAESLLGQVETGRITGTVSDSSGAILPGVEVTIIAVQVNRHDKFVTDNEGRYSSGPLRVGEYRIEAQAAGFKRLVRDAISLQVQETAVVNLKLQVGEITEQVTVTAAESLVSSCISSGTTVC